MAKTLKEAFAEQTGPEIKFGNHSSYHIEGDSILVTTKRGNEEMPNDVWVDFNSKRIIFEDSKGTLKLKFNTKSKIPTSGWFG